MNYITNKDHISTAALHDPNYIAHHGIKGQKWGLRRFQNEDGSLTSAGKNRYLNNDGSLTQEGAERFKKDAARLEKRQAKITQHEARKQLRKRLVRNSNLRAIKKGRGTGAHSLAARNRDISVRHARANMRRADRAYKRIERRYGSVGLSKLPPDVVANGERIRKQRRYDTIQMLLLGSNSI